MSDHVRRKTREKILELLVNLQIEFEQTFDESSGDEIITAFCLQESGMRELADLQIRYRLAREVRMGSNYVAFHLARST